MNKNPLNDYETSAVLSFFLYTMSMDTRRRLMHEMPVAYNKLMGREVVTTAVTPLPNTAAAYSVPDTSESA